MGDRFLDALHQRCAAALQLEVVAYQHLHRIGDHDCARWGQVRHPGSQVRRQPVDVVLGGVEIHQPAVHPNPDIDLDPEPATCLLAEPGHLPSDFQTGLHRASHVVLVGNRVTEHRLQSVTLGGANVPLVPLHDVHYLLAIAPHQQAIGLWLDPRGQRRRIN